MARIIGIVKDIDSSNTANVLKYKVTEKNIETLKKYLESKGAYRHVVVRPAEAPEPEPEPEPEPKPEPEPEPEPEPKPEPEPEPKPQTKAEKKSSRKSSSKSRKKINIVNRRQLKKWKYSKTCRSRKCKTGNQYSKREPDFLTKR